VFGIEIDTCARRRGTRRIIASIEQPEPIAKILAHLERPFHGRKRVGAFGTGDGDRAAVSVGAIGSQVAEVPGEVQADATVQTVVASATYQHIVARQGAGRVGSGRAEQGLELTHYHR
jgi:hypothetical protein